MALKSHDMAIASNNQINCFKMKVAQDNFKNANEVFLDIYEDWALPC